MAQNEVEFLFKARDEVSKVLATLNREIEQTTRAAGNAADAAGRQTQGFTRWIREQRTEQRMQNFLFREGSQAIGAAAFALTALNASAQDASSSTKALANSLTQGFVAFQALDFALGSLLGPWGLLAAAVAGGTAALFAYNAEQEKTVARNKEVALSLDVLRAKASGWSSDVVAALGQQWIAARKALEDYKKQSTQNVSTRNELEGKALQAQIAYNEAVKALGKDVQVVIDADKKAKQDRVDRAKRAADEEAKAFEQLFARIFPTQARLNQQITDRIELYKKLGGAASYAAIEQENAARLRQQPPTELQEVQVRRPNLPEPDFSVLDRVRENFMQLGETSQLIGDTITNTMTNAAEVMAGVFTGAFDRIDQAFKALVQSMLAELIKIGILKLFTGLLTGGASVGVDVGSGVVGGLIGKTAAVGVPSESTRPAPRPREEEPVQKSTVNTQTITINVQSDARYASVATRKRVMRQIEEAIYSEKA